MEAKLIVVFDTDLESLNSGDKIIMDSISSTINEIFPKENRRSIATHREMSMADRILAFCAARKFVGGTNILDADISQKRQWKLRKYDWFFVGGSVLFGCGWREYEPETTEATRQYWRKILSHTGIHSVRDHYTRVRLEEMGLKNVIVTGCPTTWSLTEDHCRKIPETASEFCVITLTDYRQNSLLDKEMIQCCLNIYERVYFWPQGAGDLKYFRSLELEGVEIISGDLSSFDNLLSTLKVDYVGTRLHGGIRAMQFGQRSLIISVDNRTVEMAKLNNFPILAREEVWGLRDVLLSDFSTRIEIPAEEIKIWKQQFLDS
jgi:hypothetical protein